MPTTFVRTTPDGKKQTRLAYTAADEVALMFDGWTVEKSAKSSDKPATASKPDDDKAADAAAVKK